MSAFLAPDATAAQAGWDASVVEWLAGLFMGPMSVQTVAGYRDGPGAHFLLAMMEEPGCAPGARQMQLALSTPPSAAVAARGLAAAFTWLFDGPGGPGALPYESAHIGGSGRLFREPVGEMERMLRQAGVSPITDYCEPADHLSVELALLAHMMRGGAELTTLLDAHLLVWLPRFAAQCCDADASGFYAGAARVLVAFLAARRTAPRPGCATEPVTGELPWRTR